MKVRALKSFAGVGFGYAAGKIVDIDDNQARQWVEDGLVVAVAEPKAEATTVEASEKRKRVK